MGKGTDLKTKKFRTTLDAMLSKMLREQKGSCEKCGSIRNLQAAHIISRKNSSIRLDIDNLLCLCDKCHTWWHIEPLESAQWFHETWPDRYERLQAKRNKAKTIKTIKSQFELLQLAQKKKRTALEEWRYKIATGEIVFEPIEEAEESGKN